MTYTFGRQLSSSVRTYGTMPPPSQVSTKSPQAVASVLFYSDCLSLYAHCGTEVLE